MNTTSSRRLGVGLALMLGLTPVWFGQAGGPAAPPKAQYFKGQVVPLAEVLGKAGARLDADAVPFWLALVTDDGKVYPLVKDAGSRMFFKDAKVLKRPMRLTARQLSGSNLLQVINMHSYVKGQLHDIYYWCDICSIRTSELDICDCCGGPMAFREVPLK